MRSIWHVGLALFLACGSSGTRQEDRPRDAGPARRSKLPADGGLFVDPDRREEELGRDILADLDRARPRARIRPDQVTIGAAYAYRFGFSPGEVPDGDRALAVPVTLRGVAAGTAASGIALLSADGTRLAAEPIVEWLDETGTSIVPPPEGPAATEQQMLLIYFAPRSFSSGFLAHGDARLGAVRVGGDSGPVRPRSTCELLGAFSYAPIPRKLLLELRVRRGFSSWTPHPTSVDATVCAGYRRLDERGRLLQPGTPPPPDEAFPPIARFLAVYDLPEGASPVAIRWEGTDCDAIAIPAREPLPRRLGPERGPPDLETVPGAPR